MDERIKFAPFLFVALYIGSIISANLLIAKFGPSLAIIIAFIFIGLDLTSRDQLHEIWRYKNLTLKMGSLIFLGSLISYLINRDSKEIAIASFAAFAIAAIIDSLIYHLLRDKSRFIKINGSNIFSAAADSIIFPLIAFGAFLPIITIGQFAAKTIGGLIWLIILKGLDR